MFRIACIREDANLLALAERCLDRAESDLASAGADLPRAEERSSEWWESRFGIAWLCALMGHSCWDLHRRSGATQEFLRLCNSMLECRTVSVNPSALLASSLLLDAFRWDPTSNYQSLIDVGNRLFDRLWDELDSLPPLAGPNDRSASSVNWTECLYAALQWMRATQASAPPHLSSRLDQLAAQARSRDTRACVPSQAHSGALAGCTGNATFVFLWTLASRVLRDPRWLRLAEAAGRDAAAFCPEGSCLHDLVGNAYGQLCLYKHTGDRCWLDNAYEVANAAVCLANDAYQTRDLGLAVLIKDLAHPRCSAMPFFEEECWPAPAG